MHRKAWNELASLFDPQNEHEKEVIIKFLDRDMRLYRPLPTRFFEKWSRTGLENHTRFWLSFVTKVRHENPQSKYILNQILSHIKQNQASWKNKYNIEIPNSKDLELFRSYIDTCVFGYYSNIALKAKIDALEVALYSSEFKNW